MNILEKVVIIVAGGMGSRMQSPILKQFHLLGGLPVLMHTIKVFHNFDTSMKIIVVIPEAFTDTWDILCRQYGFEIPHEVKTGGESRFDSVKKGIKGIQDHCLVAIHDGVRPLVSKKTIDRCFAAALKYGNAVPCIDIPESLRKIESHENIQVDRKKHRLIQTPQVFNSSILKAAYEQDFCENYTDDASVVEKLGYKIHLVEGNTENIKITKQHDLIFAETILKSGIMN